MAMSGNPPSNRPGRAYHHGNLVDALIAGAVEMIEAKGLESLSLRDLSKQVGVSPGAPFRHFKSKAELLTAVAEQSMSRLTLAVQSALLASAGENPLARLGAIGESYVDWALCNPTHFKIISSRTLINFNGSPKLVEENDAIYDAMIALVIEGQASGRIRTDATPHDLVVNARAFAYGIARMAVDGHFEEWRITGDRQPAASHALELYVRMLAPN